MPDSPPKHNGKQPRTYRRGSEYVSNIMGAVCTDVHIGTEGDRITHADLCFASRHRDDDNFRQAEAIARAYTILVNANEQSIIESPAIARFCSILRPAAYEHLVKWSDDEP